MPETADNQNYISINALNIELYTENKNIDAESAVEDVLNDNNLPFTKAESYIESESMYEVLYQTEVIINNG